MTDKSSSEDKWQSHHSLMLSTWLVSPDTDYSETSPETRGMVRGRAGLRSLRSQSQPACPMPRVLMSGSISIKLGIVLNSKVSSTQVWVDWLYCPNQINNAKYTALGSEAGLGGRVTLRWWVSNYAGHQSSPAATVMQRIIRYITHYTALMVRHAEITSS